MPKISFADLKGFRGLQPKYTAEAMLGVPGRKARIRYYAEVMPLGAARRLARIFTITRGSRRFNEGVRDGIVELRKHIRLSMKANKYTREQAIQSVWRNLAEKYRRAGFTVASSADLYHLWLNDVVESPQ